MATSRIDGLEIDQDLGFQRRSWSVQRAGWVLLTLVVLAAAAGLLGSGPLSQHRKHVAGVMSLEYHRFVRLQSTETLTVRLEPVATASETARIAVDREFLRAVRMEAVTPPPARVEAAAGRLVYVFAVAEPRIPLVVTFTFQPQQMGPHRGVIGVESSPAAHHVAFRQLVYP